MQRADKVGLIVASVLVVLLAAGAAFLLVKRSDTLAKERPADTTVRLTQFEDTQTAAATETAAPAKPAKPAVPVAPKGYVFGYVTKVGGSGKALYVKWDLAELLTGKEADLFAKKRGAVLNTKPYFIANDTKKIKTYDLPSTARIVVAASDGSTSTIASAELNKRWNAGELRDKPWFLYVNDGVVRGMIQVVLPDAGAQ